MKNENNKILIHGRWGIIGNFNNTPNLEGSFNRKEGKRLWTLKNPWNTKAGNRSICTQQIAVSHG